MAGSTSWCRNSLQSRTSLVCKSLKDMPNLYALFSVSYVYPIEMLANLACPLLLKFSLRKATRNTFLH